MNHRAYLVPVNHRAHLVVGFVKCTMYMYESPSPPQAYQTLLLSFLSPTNASSPVKPDWFVDPMSTGGSAGEVPDFASTVYENGLKVVPSYACTLRERYDTLLTNTTRRKERLLEGKAQRDELDGLLDAFQLKLSELEEVCGKLGDSRETAPEKIQARMEALQVRRKYINPLPSTSYAHINPLPSTSYAHINPPPSTSYAHINPLPSTSYAHINPLPCTSYAHINPLPSTSYAHINPLSSTSFSLCAH